MSPAGGFLTPGPPGKSWAIILNEADILFVAEESELKACLPAGSCRCESVLPQWLKAWKYTRSFGVTALAKMGITFGYRFMEETTMV